MKKAVREHGFDYVRFVCKQEKQHEMLSKHRAVRDTYAHCSPRVTHNQAVVAESLRLIY